MVFRVDGGVLTCFRASPDGWGINMYYLTWVGVFHASPDGRGGGNMLICHLVVHASPDGRGGGINTWFHACFYLMVGLGVLTCFHASPDGRVGGINMFSSPDGRGGGIDIFHAWSGGGINMFSCIT